ncbi:MAG: DUF2267 domain-containing protein [Spirochaetota bacterium]
MGLDFNQYAQDGNEFMHRLARELGHPDREDQAAILLRAVLHALRDRISMQENLHVVSQLPMFLKGVYVDQWSYSEELDRLKTADEFARRVEENQEQLGEQRFDWNASTQELITKVLASVEEYLTEGEVKDIKSELPDEIAALV